MADNIATAICLFYPLYCDIISLTSLKIKQTFLLLLGCAENWTVFWDFYIPNSVGITEGSDNGGSDSKPFDYYVYNYGHDFYWMDLL